MAPCMSPVRTIWYACMNSRSSRCRFVAESARPSRSVRMRWNFTGSEVHMASASRSFDSNTTDADAGVQNDHARMAHASKPRAHLFITPPWPIPRPASRPCRAVLPARDHRSEEHTSELQSLMRISYAVFCLKKKKNTKNNQQLQK